MEHYIRSRPLKWIINNPLLLLRTRAFSGEYYENQLFLLIELYYATALVAMLSVLSKRVGTKEIPAWSSTARVNNFQTLDIKHYMAFQVPVRRHRRLLDVKCIPMNCSRTELAELSDLNIDLDPREWKIRRRFLDRVRQALDKTKRGYMRHSVGAGRDSMDARIHRKMYDAVGYFKRSFRSRSRIEEGVINLAVAFEVLLTDHYSRGVEDRIVRRVRLALRGTKGTRAMQNAVKELYKCRSAIVHQGRSDGKPDMHKSRQAFVYAFLSVAEKLPRSFKHANTPIADLLKDP